MKPAGPPKFMNRVPSRSIARSSGRQDCIPHYIPLTRARPLNGAYVHIGGAIARGGRPFAPRVSIERGDLPGTRTIDLRFDFEARFARAASLAFALPTPKRSTRLNNEGTRFSGVAFALLYSSCSTRSQRGDWMRTPTIRSLETVSLEEALAYLDAADGDELGAAFALATDRNQLDGSSEAPDDAEVHHALFLLRKARGLDAPSFDLMRVQLKRRVAA
jgi:hypothetical protein